MIADKDKRLYKKILVHHNVVALMYVNGLRTT